MLIIWVLVTLYIHPARPSSPNIIFIFADDLGNADVGYQGSDIMTPNIDVLANSGVILNQHYVQPMCSPTRAAFITGRYPIHTGFQNGNIQQGELWGLGLHEFTIAEMFQEYGYATHAVGKWHLGWRTWRHTPIHRGFDTFLGFYFCAHDHYQYNCGNLGKRETDTVNRTDKKIKKRIKKRIRAKKNSKWLDSGNSTDIDIAELLNLKANLTPKQKYFDLRENWFDSNHVLVDKLQHQLVGQYSANVFTDAAMKKIKNRGDDPFFIYLNYMNVHAPYQAPQHYLDKYTAHMTGASRDRKAYAAMMSSMDEGIGNITKLLLSEGIYNNTILVFASDNGANVGYCSDEGMVGKKEPGSNYPLRGGKRSIFEGGIKSVAFVHSPLITNRGRTMHDLIHVVDWFKTFEDIASDGFKVKPKYKIKERMPTDSVSAWRAIKKGSVGRRRKFLINIDKRASIKCGPASPFKGIRKNQWKLIVGGGGPPSGWYNPYSPGPIISPKLEYLELYNINMDPSETFNLASEYPGVVLNLLQELNVYRRTMRRGLRKKKVDLTPWLVGDIPTPLQISDIRNNETFYAEEYF